MSSNARVGKMIEFDLGDGVEDKAAEVKRMCETLLANTVIESYRIEVA
jgi:phosphoribosylformylglycinamidine synthase PurS subunit